MAYLRLSAVTIVSADLASCLSSLPVRLADLPFRSCIPTDLPTLVLTVLAPLAHTLLCQTSRLHHRDLLVLLAELANHHYIDTTRGDCDCNPCPLLLGGK